MRKHGRDMPPGDDIGKSMPMNDEHKRGYGANRGDMNRGHLRVDPPSQFEDPHPQRRGGMDHDGFLDRPLGSFDR